ncbi:MAG: hypothetical protein LC135_14845 [Phycisphaerae bacterium]|nr:hypothetical protein [Phycisphaerae bacterium]MCZ2401121.1 hypothetical protein [Phycisphaerae bacterium]NUQ50945.1 hypothetical protein [Phycisphaerae bacterium]
MTPDDKICYCYDVPLRKLLSFAKRERPRHPSQLSECLGAGTGCGWCIPTLCRIAQWAETGEEFWHALQPEDYAAQRETYRRERRPRHTFDPPPPAPPTEPALSAGAAFAVLEHTAPDGVHWDLLISLPGQERLATWRLRHNPLVEPAPMPAERIADHRRRYLEYEGPLEGGRGMVRRLEDGGATVLEAADERVRVRLAGRALRGVAELTRRGPEWTFRMVCE